MHNVSKSLAAFVFLLGTSACQAQVSEPLHPVSFTGGTGPYPATAATVKTMPQNTLFLPKEMSGKKLPVVLWGNGGCKKNALAYGEFLRDIASYGYLVIAAGEPIEEVPSVVEQARAKLSGEQRTDNHQVGGPDKTSAGQLLQGLDWVTKVSQQAGHALNGQVDIDKIAVMGHSCGGLQAIEVATDPRVDTVVIFNSGVINEPITVKSTGLPKFVQSTALKVGYDMLEKVTVPLAYINGGPADIAYFNALEDFNKIDKNPVVFAENGVGHGGTFRYPNGGAYSNVARYWLDWQLKGSEEARGWFSGKECRLCKDFDWQVQSKNLGQ